ncbi:hypothetical protein E4T56_gene6046, partial [Termitomyces sp. T112]
MAGREDEAPAGAILADDMAGRGRGQDAPLPHQHTAITIGGGHADRLLDHGAVVIAPVAADHQSGPFAPLDHIEHALDEILGIIGACEYFHLLAQARSPRLLPGDGLGRMDDHLRGHAGEFSKAMERYNILLVIKGNGAVNGTAERGVIDRGELHPGGRPGLDRGQIGIHHRIGQPPRARHHRHAAIGQTVQLRQAARLEPAGHEDGVAPRLHPVRERLVIADAHRNAPRMARGGGGKFPHQRRIARPQQRQTPPHPGQMVEALRQHIHALLPGQTADHDEQRAIVTLKAEFRLQRALVGQALAKRARGEMALDCRVAGRVPFGRVDAVDNAMDLCAPTADQAFEPHAEMRLADFHRIGGRDGGDRMGRFQPGLQQAHAAMIFHAIDRPCLRRKTDLVEQAGGEMALKGHVVDGHHRWHGPPAIRREFE